MNAIVTAPGEAPSLLWTPLRSNARWVLTVAAAVAGLAHIPVISPHLAKAPYMGLEFIVLTIACLLIAVTAVVCDSVALWSLAGVTCALAVIGYVATRLVAFPLLSDDVGNWLEPLGVVSVTAEVTVLVTCAVVAAERLARSHRRRAPHAAVTAANWSPPAGVAR